LLSDRLSQPFVIENRPGARGSLVAEAVVKASPDGYTRPVNPADAIRTVVSVLSLVMFQRPDREGATGIAKGSAQPLDSRATGVERVAQQGEARRQRR
jgi:hypothetical protein